MNARQPVLRTLTLVATLALSACAVGPSFRAPKPAVTAQWSAPLPHDGQPAELTAWWQQLNDPLLTELITTAERTSPTLDAALARVREARALAWQSGARLLPEVTANAQGTRSRGIFGFQEGAPLTGISETARGTFDARWELDLFGGSRRVLEAARARSRARDADWHAARVSLAAEVASTYAGLRTCEARVQMQQSALDSRRNTRDLTALKVKAGLAPAADEARGDAVAAETAAALAGQRAECARTRNALTYLTGIDGDLLRSKLAGATPAAGETPQVVATATRVDLVPADALRQRPDVAAAEAEWAAATAEIGVSVAELLPSVTLSGSLGRERTELGGTKFTISPWSFGPALSLPVFDAGNRIAGWRAAKARADGAGAAYRDTVRAAVREVEDALVTLDAAVSRADDADRAAKGYARAFTAAEARYQRGLGSLLELEDLRRASLQADDTRLAVANERTAAWIALYKALGGGWTREAPSAVAAAAQIKEAKE